MDELVKGQLEKLSRDIIRMMRFGENPSKIKALSDIYYSIEVPYSIKIGRLSHGQSK